MTAFQKLIGWQEAPRAAIDRIERDDVSTNGKVFLAQFRRLSRRQIQSLYTGFLQIGFHNNQGTAIRFLYTYAIALAEVSAFTSRESEGRRQLRHDDVARPAPLHCHRFHCNWRHENNEALS